MGAFEDARDTLFADDNLAQDGFWAAGGTGPPVAVRLLKTSPDRTVPMGLTRALVGTDMFRLRKSDIAAPAAGDGLTLAAGGSFVILGTPSLDARGLIWTIEARPARL